MSIVRPITRGVTRSLTRGLTGGIAGGSDDGGIPFILPVVGQPLDPAWQAFKATALTGVVAQDGLLYLGERYGSANLTAFNAPNLLTYPIRADLNDLQRTFSIPPWIKGHVGGPYYHILTSSRLACASEVEEAALPIKYGSARATDVDGSSSDLHVLKTPFDIGTVPTAPIALSVFCNFRFDALGGAEETLFSLYNPSDPTDFICVRKLTNNAFQVAIFLNGSVVGTGTNLIYDFDVAAQGGIGVDGWCALEIVRSSGALTMTFRVFLNGVDAASNGAYQVGNAGIVTAGLTTLTHMRRFARPDDSLKMNGRHNRLVLVHALASADQWDDIGDNAVDPTVEFPNARRDIDLCGRTPFDDRNRINAEPPASVTGTPTLIASAVDTPFDALYTGQDPKLSADVTSQSYYLPPSDGLWEFMGEPGKDAVQVGLRWEQAATLSAPSQIVSGKRHAFAGAGGVLHVIASAPINFWVFPLLSSKGP